MHGGQLPRTDGVERAQQIQFAVVVSGGIAQDRDLYVHAPGRVTDRGPFVQWMPAAEAATRAGHPRGNGRQSPGWFRESPGP